MCFFFIEELVLQPYLATVLEVKKILPLRGALPGRARITRINFTAIYRRHFECVTFKDDASLMGLAQRREKESE